MRKILLINLTLITILLLALPACGPSTRISASWKSPEGPPGRYKNIFIATLSRNVSARQAVEDQLAARLQEQGVTAVKSLETMEPDFSRQKPAREELLNKVNSTGAQAVITVTFLKREAEQRYVRGAPYAPLPRFGYYGSFWGYYNYWYGPMYDPGYYTTDKTYFFETNVYDTKTEKLVWSGQSETYNPTSIDNFARGFAQVVVARLKQDGII